ncbi:hypothetical protein [Novosphingobium aureum]|uniref:hypothetical protein n=1 Tax=Novosphingobium aureum TaxID=2792964 RepID=UPI002B4A078F|nr:hypothetical protein [Novosphingobium aureum]
MTVGAGQIAGTPAASGATGDAARRAWETVHADPSIQFEPLAPVPPPKTPDWVRWLGELLEAIFAPIGRLLGMSWPVFQWVLVGLAVLLVLYAAWRIVWPMILARRAREKADEEDVAGWVPDRGEAAILLRDADALAAAGRYGEAAHLLLRRSVRQISDTRPDWLHPASTAREIARLEALPEAGRRAFAVIAQGAERAVFALRDLDEGEWHAAREAYARFAAIDLPGRGDAGLRETGAGEAA